MMSKQIQEFAKKVTFKKTKDGWKNKAGFHLSEEEITNYYNEVERIKGNARTTNITENS